MIVNHFCELDFYAAGFYRVDDENNLLYAPTAVYAPDYTLLAAERFNYTYPINGWYWFESYEQAVAQWSIELPPTEEEILAAKQAQVEELKRQLGL